MPKIERTYGEVKFSFAPLKLGYMKQNRDLLKTAVVKGGMDDLIAQEPIVVESLRAAGMPVKKAQQLVDELDVPDLYDAVKAVMEASGFAYAPVKLGEDQPAKG